MADDRPAETEIDAIARISADLADLRSTVLVRAGRSPTGTLEPTFLALPKPDTIFLQGQTLVRATYPVLWQWVLDNNLILPNVFGVGDGSTTFTVPDMRGRIIMGVGTLGGDTYALGDYDGAAFQALSTANMPAHNHAVSVTHSGPHTHGFTTNNNGNHGHTYTTDGGGDHQHGFLTDQSGNHDGHFPAQATYVPSGNVYGVAAWNSPTNWSGTHNHGGTTAYGGNHAHTGGTTWQSDHNHGGTTGNDGAYGHNITQSTIGSNTATDMRQPSIALNIAMYT